MRIIILGAGRFQAGDIDPSICSHIIYSFVGMKESTSRIYSRDPGLDLAPGEEEPDPDDEVNYQGDLDMLRKTVRLRDEGNSDLKILMAVGGPQQSQQSFSIMAADAERRRQFVESAVEYITRFNLDGLDLYWLYPAVEADKQNFVQIMKVRMQRASHSLIEIHCPRLNLNSKTHTYLLFPLDFGYGQTLIALN